MKNEEIYRIVRVAERLPEKDGRYLTELGIVQFKTDGTGWQSNQLCLTPALWYEPIMPSTEVPEPVKVLDWALKQGLMKPTFFDAYEIYDQYQKENNMKNTTLAAVEVAERDV